MKKILIIFAALVLLTLTALGIIAVRNVSMHSDIEEVEQTSDITVEQLEEALEESSNKEQESQDEQEPETAQVQITKEGSFVVIDALHQAEGIAQFITSAEGAFLKLSDFKSIDGPDLFVYLSEESDPLANNDLGEYISLGRLQALEGDQVYTLPENHEDYNSVVIWCRAFGVFFSVANLSVAN